jgi:DNA replication protein DnaC
MKDHFIGDPNLLKKYNEYVEDIPKRYQTGESFCLAGLHGLGKTMVVTNILKKAVNKGYTGLYTTLSDIVSTITQGSQEDALIARKELALVNFLVIDEFDNRFTSSENSSNLYARTLEGVFRTRAANKQPTLMCTNSPNIVESFSGAMKSSIDSLLKGYITMFPVFGIDQRTKEK